MRVIYIDIDACRPDHLGCYGYRRNTSPTIDAIAARGVRLDNYYTSDAPCLPSRTAFYTGRFGIHTGVVGHGGTAADPFTEGAGRDFRDEIELHCLPAHLQNAGYHTAQISPFGQRHAARQFYAGFNEIHNTGHAGMESAEQVQPIVDEWLAKHVSKDDWYLHINYWDPHTPYRAPEEFGNPFANDPLPEWLTDEVIQKHQAHCGPHSAQDVWMWDEENPWGGDWPRQPGAVRNREQLRSLIDGYDCGIRYVDDQIASIVRRLKEAGIYDDTAIIISADHGENLGELEIYAEHGTADHITCRVPFIVKWPGIAGGRSFDGLHYNVDTSPTVMDLVGGESWDKWDGESFAPFLRDGTDTARQELIVSQCAHVCQRAVRWDHYIYIRTYHDGMHLFPREMLFDLATDPHEQHDLAAERPDLCREAAHRLLEWHQDAMTKSSSNIDPLWTVMREGGPMHARPLPSMEVYCARLEATGRAWAIPELRRRHPEHFLPLHRSCAESADK